MTDNSADSNKVHKESDTDTLPSVIDKLGGIARAASGGSFVFRDEPKYYPEISSSLYREYRTMLIPLGDDGFDIRHVEGEILTAAARYVDDLTPEDLLSQLQHYGYPTNLVDFTADYLNALFFACPSEPKNDGRVILLNTDTNLLLRMRAPANRIKAQKSVFVSPPTGVVNPGHIICFPSALKLPMLEYLSSYHDISAQTIHDDIQGFIKNAEIHRSAYAEFHMGGLHLSQGHFEEALRHYNRSIELNSYQQASFANRAVTFIKMKKYGDGIQDFSRVITLDRHDARAYQERERAYWDSGQPELGEQDYSEAIRLDERLEGAYIGRSACRVNRRDIDGAMQDLNFVIDVNPKSSAAYKEGVSPL